MAARKKRSAGRKKSPARGARKGRARRSESRVRRLRRSAGRLALRGALVLVALVLVATIGPLFVLRFHPPPQTAFMRASHERDPATGRACPSVAYTWVPWAAISPHVPRAVLVAEDQRFLMHSGFDGRAMRSAALEFAGGGRLRGASTVTQQLAKNLFLSPDRSVGRKAIEAWLTVWLEVLWPKRRIVETYVNVAQFGPCVFGVEAASRRYFGVPASAVSQRQAALLAAVLPAPGKMRVDDPGPHTRERAEQIRQALRTPGGPAYLRGL